MEKSAILSPFTSPSTIWPIALLKACNWPGVPANATLVRGMASTVRATGPRRDCGAAKIQRIAESAPCWPDMNT
jgi:hypothetical protein